MTETVEATQALNGNGHDDAIQLKDRSPSQILGEGELGAPGTKFFNGFLDSPEFNPKLEGRTGIANIRKMLADAQVQAVQSVVTLPIRTAQFDIEAEDPKVKEFLEEALFQRINWDRFVQHSLLAYSYGYELMETVVELDDNRFWFKKLSHRGQETIEKWFPDPDDQEVIGKVQQRVWKNNETKTIDIPGDKLFHLAWDQIGNNFTGRSGLRAAYKPWFMKEEFERIGAMGVERFGLGVPKMEMPAQYGDGDLAAAKSATESFQAGRKARIVLPAGYKFDIIGAPAVGENYQPLPWIRYCDEMIATSVLAMILTLGKTEHGPRALGETMLDLFMISLGAIADWFVESVTEQLIRNRLLAWNYPDAHKIKAKLVWSNLQLKNVQMVSEALDRLTRNGIITPDDPLEDAMRKWMDVPERDKGTSPEPKAPEAQDATVKARAHRHSSRCSHGHVRAQDTPWWRDPFDHERHMALREIDGRIDDGRDQIAGVYLEQRPIWVEELIHQLTEAASDGDYSDIADVGVPLKMVREGKSDIVSVDREMFVYGRQTVRSERTRQLRGTDVNVTARDEAPEPKEITTLFNTRADRYLMGLAARLAALAVEQALGLIRAKGDDFTSSDWALIAAELNVALEATALNDATVLVGEALGFGRDDAAQKIAEGETVTPFYSAILDSLVCAECVSEDGKEFVLGSPEYYEVSPPNKGCYSARSGSNRCRCLWVYIFEEAE